MVNLTAIAIWRKENRIILIKPTSIIRNIKMMFSLNEHLHVKLGKSNY